MGHRTVGRRWTADRAMDAQVAEGRARGRRVGGRRQAKDIRTTVDDPRAKWGREMAVRTRDGRDEARASLASVRLHGWATISLDRRLRMVRPRCRFKSAARYPAHVSEFGESSLRAAAQGRVLLKWRPARFFESGSCSGHLGNFSNRVARFTVIFFEDARASHPKCPGDGDRVKNEEPECAGRLTT
jgi:hypothetical protein